MLVVSTPAMGVITVDPDAFSAGTVLNNAYPGVTLTALGWTDFAMTNPIGPNVLSTTSGRASTGTRVFGHTGSNPPGWGDGIWEYLRVDFAVDATWVSLDFIADNTNDNDAILEAYDASNNLVASAASVGNYNDPQVVTLTVSAPNIAYILALGDPIDKVHDWELDNLQYQPIPAPGAILLGGIGVALVGWLRRRRTL